MFKSLIAAAAVSTAVLGTAVQAEAKTNFDLNVVIGAGDFGYHDGYYGRPEFPIILEPRGHGHHYPRHFAPRPRFVDVFDDGISCRQGARILRRNGFNGIEAFDCSAPTYGYTAWRNHRMFNVKVDFDGDIISVRRARR